MACSPDEAMTAFKSSVAEAFQDDVLNIRVVFNDQDKQLACHLRLPLEPTSQRRGVHAISGSSFRRKCAKVHIKKIRARRIQLTPLRVKYG